MPHPDMNESWVGGHPDEGLLHEWLDEQLSAQDSAEMQAHVDSCAECQARVAEARGLIAASHRILSALDEVPANVIPTNIPEKAPSEIVIAHTSNGRDAASAVTSIDAARAKAAAKTKRVIPWNSLGKIAAVLVFVVAIAKSGFMIGDDVVAPMTGAKEEAAPVADARASDVAAAAPAGGSSAIATLAAPAPAAAASAAAAPAASETPKVAAKSAPRQSGSDVASTRNQNVVGAVAANTAAGAGTAEALADKRADDSRGLRARVADAGVADRTEAEKRRASEPQPAAKASAALPELQGKVAAMQVRAAPSASASKPSSSVATPPVASAPVATPATPPPLATPVPLAVPTTTGVAGGRAMRASEVSGFAAGASTPSPVLPGAMLNERLRSTRALPFDSVTLTRNACLPNCDAGTLWISARGELRYRFGSGIPQRSITGTLSNIGFDSLTTLVRRTFPDSTTREGRMSCEVQQGEQIDLNIFFSAVAAPDRMRGCTRSTAEIRQLARALEAMVLLESIKEALPPRDP